MTSESQDLDFSKPKPVIETNKNGKWYVYVVLDNDIAKRLGISEEDCRFAQAIVDNGIMFKLVRKGDSQA